MWSLIMLFSFGVWQYMDVGSHLLSIVPPVVIRRILSGLFGSRFSVLMRHYTINGIKFEMNSLTSESLFASVRQVCLRCVISICDVRFLNDEVCGDAFL